MASSAGRKCPVTRAYPNTEEPDRCDAEQHHRGRVPDQVVGQQVDVVADLVQVEHFMLRARRARTRLPRPACALPDLKPEDHLRRQLDGLRSPWTAVRVTVPTRAPSVAPATAGSTASACVAARRRTPRRPGRRGPPAGPARDRCRALQTRPEPSPTTDHDRDRQQRPHDHRLSHTTPALRGEGRTTVTPAPSKMTPPPGHHTPGTHLDQHLPRRCRGVAAGRPARGLGRDGRGMPGFSGDQQLLRVSVLALQVPPL